MAWVSSLASKGGSQLACLNVNGGAYSLALSCSVSRNSTVPSGDSTRAMRSAVQVLPDPGGPERAMRALAASRLASVTFSCLIASSPRSAPRAPDAGGRRRCRAGGHRIRSGTAGWGSWTARSAVRGSCRPPASPPGQFLQLLAPLERVQAVDLDAAPDPVRLMLEAVCPAFDPHGAGLAERGGRVGVGLGGEDDPVDDDGVAVPVEDDAPCLVAGQDGLVLGGVPPVGNDIRLLAGEVAAFGPLWPEDGELAGGLAGGALGLGGGAGRSEHPGAVGGQRT